jgi:hypothetical protein
MTDGEAALLYPGAEDLARSAAFPSSVFEFPVSNFQC